MVKIKKKITYEEHDSAHFGQLNPDMITKCYKLSAYALFCCYRLQNTISLIPRSHHKMISTN